MWQKSNTFCNAKVLLFMSSEWDFSHTFYKMYRQKHVVFLQQINAECRLR